MAENADLEVPDELEGRLADVGHNIQMVQKCRNLAPNIGANESLFAILDRFEGELRGKQTRLQAEKMRLVTPDS